MNTIFTRGPSISHRLTIALVASVLLIFVDQRLDGFSATRVYLNSLVSPLQYLADLPGDLLNWSARRLTTQQQLISENRKLQDKITLMTEQLQRFDILQQENDNLRKLLGSPVRKNAKKMIAELMAVDNNPFSHQIVINKGAIHGVYESQSVLDDNGIVGQVMQVGSTNSRVLLVSDLTHAIPVRIARNNVRMIASGSGRLQELTIEHVPHSVDIRPGDKLVSSGLGNVFPEGYPVGVISSIVRDESRPFAHIIAKPTAQLQRLKFLLLLWPDNAPKQPLLESEP